MIVGAVTARCEAAISVTIRGPGGVEREVESVIDTGSSGAISLPTAIIAELGLRPNGRGRVALADGSEATFRMRQAVVIWDERPSLVFVDEANSEPTVGMALLMGLVTTIDGSVGGTVAISPIAAQ